VISRDSEATYTNRMTNACLSYAEEISEVVGIDRNEVKRLVGDFFGQNGHLSDLTKNPKYHFQNDFQPPL
jgi:hypothetical protein